MRQAEQMPFDLHHLGAHIRTVVGKETREDRNDKNIALYQRNLDAVRKSPTPIETAMDMFFSQNGTDVKAVKARKMPYMIAEIRFRPDSTIPEGVQELLQEVYPDRRITIDSVEISMQSEYPNMLSRREYSPAIHISLRPSDEDIAGAAERTHAAFIDKETNKVRAGYLHLDPIRDTGEWGWALMEATFPNWYKGITQPSSLRHDELAKGKVSRETLQAFSELLLENPLDFDENRPPHPILKIYPDFKTAWSRQPKGPRESI